MDAIESSGRDSAIAFGSTLKDSGSAGMDSGSATGSTGRDSRSPGRGPCGT